MKKRKFIREEEKATVKRSSISVWLLLGLIIVLLAGCGSNSSNNNKGTADASLRKIKVVLDWSPNTNHTGLYVAKSKGYYAEEGLDVEIILPGSSGSDVLVASGEVPFGISFQENVTQGRTQGVPLVSIAAIIQHNTSGFAAPVDRNIQSPKDFEGKSYGGWGSPVEQAVMESIMEVDGADINQVKLLNIGEADYFTAIKRDIDFAWIFYAWTGIEAELRGESLNMIYLQDYSNKLDYYTPVIVTNETTIDNDPELIKSFMRATSKGYHDTIDHPDEAGEILLQAVPDLDKDLVMASQRWLSPKYKDDAARWGEQKREVWQNYSDWMSDKGLLEKPLDTDKAFTNDFLPE